MSRVQPLNLTNFNGGLNLRADAFQLAEGESPALLNVEIDPRGGFYSRKGWTRWNREDITGVFAMATDSLGRVFSTADGRSVTVQVGTRPWDPRSSFVHQLSSGAEYVFLTNDNQLLQGVNGLFTPVRNGLGVEVVCEAEPHEADYAPWGNDLFVACGRGRPLVKWRLSNSAVELAAPGVGSWADDYTIPSSGLAPQAELVHAHAGYLFVANVQENSQQFRSRLRWSHPNDPESWAEADFIDILDGGGAITGLASFRDHLLVFKQSSVWALFGYDSDSWQLVNVTRALGAAHRQVIAQSETAVYFFSSPAGVHAITAGGELREVSEQLRPVFQSNQFNVAAQSNMWLGWVDKRLWFGAPWLPNDTPLDAASVFVFDPSLNERGAWTVFRSGLGGGLGPFAEAVNGSGTRLHLATARDHPAVVRVDGQDQAVDSYDGTDRVFDSFYSTGWHHAGFPSTRKTWRRPDLVMKERALPYQVRVDAFHNYDESAPRRSGLVGVKTGATDAIWGEFEWGDGSLWGPAASGSLIAKGRGLGNAAAVRLRFQGEPGRAWGCDAMVLKFVQRRFR